MAEELRELIDKINEEGVQAAEEKAAVIESEARRKAEGVIERAKLEADMILSDADVRIEKLSISERVSMKQAGRDFIINLKKEVNEILSRIINQHVHKALTAEEMSGIITSIIKDAGGKGKDGIVVTVKKEDAEKLEKSLLHELKEKMKEGVRICSSGDIRGGFLISYDSGRSYYDFTDKAIAEYISTYLKPKLAEIFGDTAPLT